MKRIWTIIGVRDAPSSFKWYQSLLRGLARLEEEPHPNPNTRTKEFSLRDPDGYDVTISSLARAFVPRRSKEV